MCLVEFKQWLKTDILIYFNQDNTTFCVLSKNPIQTKFQNYKVIGVDVLMFTLCITYTLFILIAFVCFFYLTVNVVSVN